MSDEFNEVSVINEKITSDFNLDLIDELNNFFIDSSSAIYDKLHNLGSCQIKYGGDKEIFDRNAIQKICELALNDFLNIKKSSGLFSVSVNLKVKTKKTTQKNSSWVDGYTMGCAFACSTSAAKAGIKVTQRDDGKPQADTAKTRQVKKLDIINSDYEIVDTDQYEFVASTTDVKKEEDLPHHGLSFSERFIEQIEWDNLKVACGGNKIYVYPGKDDPAKTVSYEIKNKDIVLTKIPKYTREGDLKSYLFINNREELAAIFDDGSNKDENGNRLYKYPNPNSPIQHRNQAVFFPIECSTGEIKKRIGYMQLTAYYSAHGTESSTIFNSLDQSDDTDKRIITKFKFYSNWVLLINKLLNIKKTKIDLTKASIRYE